MVFISENIPDGLESLLDSTYVSGTYRQIQPPQHPNKSSPPLSMCHRPPTYPLYVGVECSYNHQWRWLKNQQYLWGMDIFVPLSGKPLKAFARIKPRLLCVEQGQLPSKHIPRHTEQLQNRLYNLCTAHCNDMKSVPYTLCSIGQFIKWKWYNFMSYVCHIKFLVFVVLYKTFL